MDETTFDCDNRVDDNGTVPNDSYAYGVVNINACLDVDDLVKGVVDTLTKSVTSRNFGLKL